jgi:hypothetical protein
VKQTFIILTSLLIAYSAFGQTDSLEVGDKWKFSHSYIRNLWDTVQLHNFDYHDGLAKVIYNDKVGFIDSNKTIVIPLIYEDELGANKFIDSRSVVIKNKKWGVIDTSNKIIFPFVYDRIKRYNDLYYVEINYEWGYIDSTGKTILRIDDYACSHIMTKQEILELANKYGQKDSLENSVSVSKDKAISIAKRKGHYYESEFPFNPSVELDTTSHEWIIKSSKSLGTTRKGKCAKTNGCTVIKETLIVIDSNNGRIKRKSKSKTLMPNYE